jgi:mono/diheme cytochrome c family protein
VTRTPSYSAVLALLGTALLASPRPSAAQDTTAASAAVAAQQVDVGEQWYRARCLECHAVGALSNADFRLKWNRKNAFELYEQIRKTMPEEAPGSLTGPTYAAIVAYLIKQNGMPVGTALPADSAGLSAVKLAFGASTTTR